MRPARMVNPATGGGRGRTISTGDGWKPGVAAPETVPNGAGNEAPLFCAPVAVYLWRPDAGSG